MKNTCTLGRPLVVLSLGAGVQSSTMALMAAAGELTPTPDCAIFADTQAEPASVYSWLDWLRPRLPFPVHVVSKGDLSLDAVRLRTSGKSGRTYLKPGLPVFVPRPGTTAGIMQRQCTETYKIEPIRSLTLKLMRQGGHATAEQWIGISTDEASRMKPSRHPKIANRWPLINDAPMTRADCVRWMADHGYPKPPRSACVFCPYHNDTEWLRLREEEPEEFARAVEFERDLQAGVMVATSLKTDVVFLHRSCAPLDAVVFQTAGPKAQLNLFENDCEGMCGV